MGNKINSLDLRNPSRIHVMNNAPLELIYENTPYGRVATNVKQKISNSLTTGNAGAGGMGDRGANETLPLFNSNPLTFTDYVQKYRQFVMLYRSSWEARKICRIPVDDALRKPWIADGIPEKMAASIQTELNRLQFLRVLKNSLILERVLGGSLTFMGMESDKDEPGVKYDPKEGKRLRFVNAVPASRITRTEWETNPLDVRYMRPARYEINGTMLDVSRALVWDGEPEFDPSDFMLTAYYSNMAGFGDSKIGPLWDDIMRAVGTRQAAYSLILVNNAIIAAVSDLQDLNGTVPGKQKLSQIKAMVQTLSLYRAAMIDGDKVQISQHSASFGSIPELLMAFLQVLSAASDIPATRFLGEAPGGLNSDGKSSLENYYNVIDAFQVQRLTPQLIRVYDVIGYQQYPGEWANARKDLKLTFPPMWNLSELEEADRKSKLLDNVIKALQERTMTEEHAIAEINVSKIFSTKLDDTDLGVLQDSGNDGPEEPPDPQGAIDKLRNAKRFQVPNQFKNAEGTHWITLKKEGTEGHGRRILLDSHGNIIGGNVPKSAQGKPVSSWWKSEPDGHSDSWEPPEEEYHPDWAAKGVSVAPWEPDGSESNPWDMPQGEDEEDLKSYYRQVSKELDLSSGSHDRISEIRKRGLNHKAVKADYGSEGVSILMRKHPGLIKKHGGASIDSLADEYGYESSDDLYEELKHYKPRGFSNEQPLDHTRFMDLIHAAETLYGFKVDLDEFDHGILIEQEHDATAEGDENVMARIVLDHLREIPDYYRRLERMEAEAEAVTPFQNKKDFDE